MLLGNKKTQENDQNWCVVLNPLPNELDKKKVARKISEVFSLSGEEASDLVSNTPIILLDNLTRSMAAKVKEYFEAAGAEMILTNDVFLKRKCYRTVWPEPPNLAFLHDWQSPKSDREEQPLSADEALDEIRSLGGEETAETRSVPAPSRDEPVSGFRDDTLSDPDAWKKECARLRHECDVMRQTIEDMNRQRAEGQARSGLHMAVQEREKEIKELRAMLSNSEEKCEGLREEYREARMLFEKKLAALQAELQSWKDKADDMAVKISEQMKNADDSERRLQERIQEAARLQRIVQENAEHQRVLQAALEQEKTQRVQSEEQRYRLEENERKLIRRLEERIAETREMETRIRDLEKNLDHVRQGQAEQEKVLQSNLSVLQSREAELEKLRRQVKEINQVTEQRELVQKKAVLAQQMAEKETRLAELVGIQERIEADIRRSEEDLRKTLSQQEALEKDLVEIKQAQRHFSEQAKKERPVRVKVARTIDEEVSPAAADSGAESLKP